MDLLKKIRETDNKPKIQGILNSYYEQIIQLIKEGYTKKQIFELLKNEKIIDCKYNNFIRIIKKMSGDKKESHKTNSKETIKNEIKKTTAPPFIKKSFVMVDLDENDLK